MICFAVYSAFCYNEVGPIQAVLGGTTMDFLELQSFVTICDCRNITEAARRLYITQPALSRRIRDLEKELGVTLFVRRSKGIEITEAGTRLYRDAVRMLEQRERFSAKAIHLQKAESAALRVAAAPYFPRTPVLRGVSSMAMDHPEVTQIFKGESGFPDLLIQDQVDIILCMKGEVMSLPDIHYEVLYDSPLSAFVGQNHRLWGREQVLWEDLAGETVVLHQCVAQTAEAFAELTLRRNCPSIKHIYFCGSIEECILYAAAGKAVALCGAGECEYLPAVPDVVKNQLVEGPSIDWSSPAAAYNPDNPFALAFIDHVKKGFYGDSPAFP